MSGKEMTNKSKPAVSAMSDNEFTAKFPDDKAAIDHFLAIHYKGDNITCPHCGEIIINIYRYRERPKFFQCSNRNNTFSPFKGTIFEKTHIKTIKWFKVIRNSLNDRAGYSGKIITFVI
jgi:predicted RNA-binding Zn-ribbon protein involved in translation (DUF1610 family)